jgi:hypothetical protein
VKGTRPDGQTWLAYNDHIFPSLARATAEAEQCSMLYQEIKFEVVSVGFFPIRSVLDRGRS